MGKPFQKKSGDSKLADAAKAREDERRAPTSVGGTEYAADVVKQVQDGVEQKLAQNNKEAAERTQIQMEKLMLSVEALMSNNEALMKLNSSLEKRILDLEARKNNMPSVRGVKKFLRCPTCHQAIMDADKDGVCDGQHVAVFVAPSSMELWPAFQGVTVNGARYAGRCLLPASIIDGVKAEISRWERSERQKFIPGGKVVGENDLKYATGSIDRGQSALI